MKKTLLCVAIVMLFGNAILFGCSGNKEAESDKGTIEKMTKKTAKKVVDNIRTPIDRARSVTEQEEDRLRDMEKTLKE